MIGVLRYALGDATKPETTGHRIIAHVCNDLGRWGSGFTIAVSRRWESPERLYRLWHRGGKLGGIPFRLGEVQFVDVGYNPERAEDRYIWVANMIAQHGLRSVDNPQPLCYDNLQKCLVKLGQVAARIEAEVIMPRIGSGRGGGRWEVIEPMIREEVVRKNVTVTVYDLRENLSS